MTTKLTEQTPSMVRRVLFAQELVANYVIDGGLRDNQDHADAVKRALHLSDTFWTEAEKRGWVST